MSPLWFLIPIIVGGVIIYFYNRKKTSSEEDSGLPTPTDKIEVVNSKGLERNYQCGHRGSQSYAISIYGELSKEVSDGQHCPECFIAWLNSFVIRCASCRLPIYPGEGVALYHKSNSGLHKDIGYAVGENYLGCMRWDCCPSGAFYGGNWDGSGFSPAFGGSVMAAAVFESGRCLRA